MGPKIIREESLTMKKVIKRSSNMDQSRTNERCKDCITKRAK